MLTDFKVAAHSAFKMDVTAAMTVMAKCDEAVHDLDNAAMEDHIVTIPAVIVAAQQGLAATFDGADLDPAFTDDVAEVAIKNILTYLAFFNAIGNEAKADQIAHQAKQLVLTSALAAATELIGKDAALASGDTITEAHPEYPALLDYLAGKATTITVVNNAAPQPEAVNRDPSEYPIAPCAADCPVCLEIAAEAAAQQAQGE